MTADLEQRLALAEHLLGTGGLERADDVLDQIAADAMDRPEFWWLRAAVKRRRGNPEAAIRAARAGLERFPQSIELLVVLGREEVDRGRLEEAERALLAALAIDPEDVDALCTYARAVALAGQDDKARRLVERAAQLAPSKPLVLATRYQLAELAGDDRETERLARELARVTDGSPQTLALLGIEATKRSDVRAGRDLLQRAAQADVRVIDALGAEAFREARAASHPLMWPLWPIHRFGPGPVWVVVVGSFLGLRAAGFEGPAVVLALVWIGYAVYSWVVPPLVRWLSR